MKAGGARLHKSWDTITPSPCSAPYACFAGYSLSGEESNWDFAYGVGTQWKFGPVAWRLEYERVNATGSESGGDPDLRSAGGELNVLLNSAQWVCFRASSIPAWASGAITA